jgi:glucosamine-6-phosphate deaminase
MLASYSPFPSHLLKAFFQYFKSIEAVASSQGFEQILPSAARTGPRKGPLPQPKRAPSPLPSSFQKAATTNGIVAGLEEKAEKEEPSILSPQPTTTTLLGAPATEYPVRAITPELVPDRMGSRIAAY